MSRFRRTPAWVLVPAALGVLGSTLALSAQSPKGRADDARYEYKVGTFVHNPGDRSSDAQRAAAYEREINKLAESGWEPVGTILNRDTVQTVGGAVTTRDTVSFVAYRRLKR